MTRMESLNSFFMERLMAVAGEIFEEVKLAVSEYQDEIKRIKQENFRLREKLTELRCEARTEGCLADSPEQQALDSEISVTHMKLELTSVKQEAGPHQTTDGSSLNDKNAHDTQPSHVDGLLPVHQNSSSELHDSEASLTRVKLELASTEEGALHQEHFRTENLSHGPELSQPIFLDAETKRHDHLQGNSFITAQFESCDQQVSQNNTRSSAAHNQRVQETNFVTVKLEPGDWFSPYCEQISGNGFRAKAHSQKFSANKSFVCDRCGSLYQSAWLLKKHLVTDHMEKSCRCDLCGKCCYDMQMLKVHLKTHSTERPFQCTICSKTYKTKSHLKDHVRTHTGDKRYSCSACGMGFFWTNQVKVHIQNHHRGQMATVLKKSVKPTRK